MIIILFTMALFTVLAVVGAEGLPWKAINFFIIAGFGFAGLYVGYGTMDGQNAIAIGISIGSVGAMCCWLGNQWRNKTKRARRPARLS